MFPNAVVDLQEAVRGSILLGFIDFREAGQAERIELFREHNITLEGMYADNWISLPNLLQAYKTYESVYGDEDLFRIGKHVPDLLMFPQQRNNVQASLLAISFLYRVYHRNTVQKSHQLTAFDEKKRVATLVSYNPYPSEFDRGVLTAALQRCNPLYADRICVELDLSKPTRKRGADQCTFQISW